MVTPHADRDSWSDVFFSTRAKSGWRTATAFACSALLLGGGAIEWVTGAGLVRAAESRGPAGQRLRDPLLVVQLPDPASTKAALVQRPLTSLLPAGGARIVLVQPDGSARPLTRAFHSACEPDVSYDGRRFLFAGKRSAEDIWNIYEMAIQGGEVRQITRGLGHCRQPGYQSQHYQISDNDDTWPQITFVRFDGGAVGEGGLTPIPQLWTCKPDGSLARPITFNLAGDVDPTIMPDGRLLLAAGRRGAGGVAASPGLSLVDVNTDGTDGAPLVVQAGKRIKRMPCITRQSAVFVESDQLRWDASGSLASVSLLRPLHTYQALTGESDGLFLSPAPLPDGNLLVSWRPLDGSARHAVYRFDLQSKRMTLVFDDSEYHDVQAKVVAPRTEPDGRSSPVIDTDPLGKLYCLNVYAPDQTGQVVLPPGSVKSVRVLEGVPGRVTERGESASALVRRILGQAPVAADGSFNIQVPANIPVELQLLDDRGLSLRTSSWVWTRNHFNQGCIGCHEDPELTPENYVAEALNHPSLTLAPPPEQRRTVTFLRDVLPLVESKCAPCHAMGGELPNLSEALASGPGQTFDAVCGITSSHPTVAGPYVHPGQARTSPLIWHIWGTNTSLVSDGAAHAQPYKLIPADAPVQLTDDERQRLVEWIDLGAAFDGDHQRPLQPISSSVLPLSGNDKTRGGGDGD